MECTVLHSAALQTMTSLSVNEQPGVKPEYSADPFKINNRSTLIRHGDVLN